MVFQGHIPGVGLKARYGETNLLEFQTRIAGVAVHLPGSREDKFSLAQIETAAEQDAHD